MSNEDEVEEFLAHFGVQGMKWGVRKTDLPGVTRKVNREASKDAQEFARAKMFYGEGAGTRRKLIKARVEAKAKANPDYQKAFDHHLSQQNFGKHADKAQTERRFKDTKESIKKTTRQVNRAINGPFAASVSAVMAAAAYAYAKSNGYDEVIIRKGTEFIDTLLKP